MTTSPAVPATSVLVEMTGSDGPVCGVRIDAVDGARLVLSLPPTAAARPVLGERLVLRWPAGHRGRYALAGVVDEAPVDDRVAITAEGDPQIEQNRNFVRGGGGEQIRLHRAGAAGSAEFPGWIRDISERGVRAHFAAATIRAGDAVRLLIHLDEDTIDVAGTALKVVDLPETDRGGRGGVEIVAVIDADEVQAQVIRRYVFRHQLLTRVRTAGD